MKKYAVLAGILVLLPVLLVGCASEDSPVAANCAAVGDRVQVHYTGKLSDGTVFDSSKDRDPLAFVIGDGNMIAGFDEAVRGMVVGQIKRVTIPAAEAYGPYREDLVVVLPREELAEDIEVGQKVPLQNVTSGETVYFTVMEITDTEVTLDANHPLAGEDLTFEIEMMSIEPVLDVTDNAGE
ncbi:MAG: peptidylprolyl isomerase [Dehalococcoidia bacterium]|jgi:peptidylprolyl isomerase